MSDWEHVDAYKASLPLAVQDLSRGLFHGELALLLGAGISSAFGLPCWPKLISDCLSSVGLPTDSIKNGADFRKLTSAAGDFRNACNSNDEYVAGVRTALYSGAKNRNQTPTTLLLTAVGAMLMGSRRGRVKEVWTLNFDDVLEWYLRVHGFHSQVITEVPSLLKDSDVTVYHPHGFLPLDTRHGACTAEIILDDTSYAVRSVGKFQPWREAMQFALRSRVFIAIGLSWTDELLKTLIFDAASEINDRPTAFWLFGPGITVDEEKDCLRNNVVPMKFGSYDEYGPFLFSICESATAHVH